MASKRWVVGCAATVATVAMVLSPNPAKAEDSHLDRGTYLMNSIVACGACHTPKDPDGLPVAGQELAGGFVIDMPRFHSVTPNITPDPETGIGKWTDEQIINAIRNGKRPDGTTIGPPMPTQFYRSMSDNDVSAIVAYLRSVKPITHMVEKSVFKFPLPDSYGPMVAHVADVSRQNSTEYGHYLANIGHCLECHTPVVKGQRDMTRIGAGGQELPVFPSGMVVSANLTPANPDGIVGWTDRQVEETITTGVRPDGRHLVRLMAFDWYKNIEKRDLDALVAYLRTLKAAKP